MTKAKIFKQIYQNLKHRQDYIDQLPTDISAAIFDNAYTNSLDQDNTLLMKVVFQEHYEAVAWFLYDCTLPTNIQNQSIKSIDDYISYIQKYEGFPI